MTYDGMYEIFDGYKNYDSSTEVKDEVTVLVCGEVKNPEEEKYTDVRILNSLSESG